MKSIIRLLKKYWLFIIGFIIILLLIFSVFRVKAQGDLVNELDARLIQLSVPIKSITLDSRIPFQITIVLQSNSLNEQRTNEDAANEYLTEREAMLAHKFGLSLESYVLILINSKGDTIDWAQQFINNQYTYFNPQFLSTSKKLNNQATKTFLIENLDFKGLILDELKVTTGVGSEKNVQTLSIRLLSQDIQTANNIIPDLIGSLIEGLNKVNQESDYSMVALFRLWIVDKTGIILLDYIYDFELGKQTWGMAPGVTTDWFPQPMPTWFPSPTPSTTPPGYPPPFEPTPALPNPPTTPYP